MPGAVILAQLFRRICQARVRLLMMLSDTDLMRMTYDITVIIM